MIESTRMIAIALGTIVGLASCSEREKETQSQPEPTKTQPPQILSKSSDCIACHEDAGKAWESSHHALAHRDSGSGADTEAFAGQEVELGDAHWTFKGGKEHPTVTWKDRKDATANPIDEEPPMAIGLTPLVQYILDTGKGRYQVPDMAWDPAKKEWFSIYGDQNRRPHEWGHWTQRGMNWNSQCAYCHFTGLKKGHVIEDDSYQTTWVEQGIGCAQCHGPNRANHGKNECLIDPAKKYTAEQWMHSCATCHARREEFDENFQIGDSFHDHYGLSLPSQPGLWHPDGQQIDEVYKFNSFLLSRMAHKGISCIHCHDPHSAEPIGGSAAVQSNALCMSCHAGGANQATIINPTEHLFHTPGTDGSRCIDCHMPKRTYMGRDPRSDHRFPIPDPLLTKELGTPNACNDCHEDKGLDWQIEWTDKWYGEKMNRPARQRTRAIAAAQTAKAGALGELLAAYDIEEIDAWKATLLRFMEPWLGDSRVGDRASKAASDPQPLTRAAAAMLLARRGDQGELFTKLLNDPIKAVRYEAAWGAFDRLPADLPAVKEVEEIAKHEADQPGGAMRMARIASTRGDPTEAEKWLKRAAEWDASSPAPRRDLAVFLGSLGRTAESVEWLEKAAALDPGNAEIPYLAALAAAELGDTAKAEANLIATINLDPGFSRAHYNLGLLFASQQRLDEAIAALKQAESTDLTNPDPPYARATIHLRRGEVEPAMNAAREALRRNPTHEPSIQFLQQFGQ